MPGQRRTERECYRPSCDDMPVASTRCVIVRNGRIMILKAIRLSGNVLCHFLRNHLACSAFLPDSRGVEACLHSCLPRVSRTPSYCRCKKVEVKQSHYRPGQAQRVLRMLRFPDFVTTAQDSGRLSALRTGRLYSQEILLVHIYVRG